MYKNNIFDSFKCAADKCRLTCCGGWAVRVEDESYEKWHSDRETRYLCDYTDVHKNDGETVRQMKQNSCQTCVLLDENGLCEIVKRHGEEMLSETCARFPRKYNEIEELDIIEYSLSGGCPEVLRLIRDDCKNLGKGAVRRLPENDKLSIEYQVRNNVIKLFLGQGFGLEEKILLSFSFLRECLECEEDDEICRVINIYSDEAELKELANLWAGEEYDEKGAFIEVLQTLLDMIQLYREEPMYKPYLYDIAEFVESIDADGKEADLLLGEWQGFKKCWNSDSAFYGDVIVSEIYGDCISGDLEYLTEIFQGIVFEYVMTRVSVFIKEIILKRRLSEGEIEEYLSLFIRMIGHNIDGMEEYWAESFEDSVLMTEYIYLVLK